MPTSFGMAVNNVVAVVGPSGYTAGSGTLTLGAGQGAQLGTLPANRFYRVTVAHQAVAYNPNLTPADFTIFQATGRSGDILTGLVATEGTTDRNYVGGDIVDVRVTAATISEIQGALNTVETNASSFGASICQGRLSLTSGDPAGVTEVATGMTLYFIPYKGNVITFYDGVATWSPITFGQTSIAIPTPGGGGVFDVFAYNNGGILALEFSNAWASSGLSTGVPGARTDALTFVAGIPLKAANVTRRYLGTLWSYPGFGAQDNKQSRQLWNYYNRLPKLLYVTDSAASWIYNGTSWRVANNNMNNEFTVVIGVKEEATQIWVGSLYCSQDASSAGDTGIGYDITTTPIPIVGNTRMGFLPINIQTGAHATTSHVTDIGIHYYYWLEKAETGVGNQWGGTGFGQGCFPGIGGRVNC